MGGGWCAGRGGRGPAQRMGEAAPGRPAPGFEVNDWNCSAMPANPHHHRALHCQVTARPGRVSTHMFVWVA
jgi:hypothetical protein